MPAFHEIRDSDCASSGREHLKEKIDLVTNLGEKVLVATQGCLPLLSTSSNPSLRHPVLGIQRVAL